MAQSLIDASSMLSASRFIAMPFMPDAYRAATTDPALVPHTRSTWMLRASSALITPMCAKPRAAPPPSARPTRMGRGGLTTGGGKAVTTGLSLDATLSDRPPVVVQAARTADAAASEKLRRLRRGDDGFNDFSSSDACATRWGRVTGASRSRKHDRRRRSYCAASMRRAHIIKQSARGARKRETGKAEGTARRV